MAFLKLGPEAGGGMSAATHRHAGAADQRIEPVALHIGGDAAPQRHDDGAAAIVAVHTRATDFEQAGLEVIQAGEIEFGFGVERAHAFGLMRGQGAVGADQASVAVAYQQVVAVGVEQIDVEAGLGRFDLRAHFFDEHLVAQALRLAHFIAMTRPGDAETLRGLSGCGVQARRVVLSAPVQRTRLFVVEHCLSSISDRSPQGRARPSPPPVGVKKTWVGPAFS